MFKRGLLGGGGRRFGPENGRRKVKKARAKRIFAPQSEKSARKP
jgi:hypothetical protein